MATQSIAVVDKQGQVLVNQPAQLPIYSLAKPIIASAVFAAGVRLGEAVAHWIGADICPAGEQISVAQLLNHTSGLIDYGALPAYQEAVAAGAQPWSDDEFIERTLHQPLLFEPGQGWSYSNPGYWLLQQILQRQSGLSFADAIARLVAQPLGLSSLRVRHGQFADDLPWYPAEWVWHGLLTADALDMVRFMRSTLVNPLHAELVSVPVNHPQWNNPHNGYGLMVDPGIRFGHNGDGPGYSSACFVSLESGLTGCVLMPASREGQATEVLLQTLADMSDH